MKNKHKHAVNLEHKSSIENNELNASMVPKLQISWKEHGCVSARVRVPSVAKKSNEC